jgi:hypothetical protein
MKWRVTHWFMGNSLSAIAVPGRKCWTRARGLHGRGVGWIDVHLLASALVAGIQLWTADPSLSEMAGEFGIAYTPPKSG